MAWVIIVLAVIFLLIPALGHQPDAYVNRYFDCMKKGFFVALSLLFWAVVIASVFWAINQVKP